MPSILLLISIISLIIWIGLLLFWGNFWQCNPTLKSETTELDNYPSVCAVIPARNEAELIEISLKSLLKQDYPGEFSIFLVDDRSRDGTAEIARETAEKLERSDRLKIISGAELPTGWTGKLWGMKQGIDRSIQEISPDYILLSDADIKHNSHNLRQLVNKAKEGNYNLVSLMVLLRCQSVWEKFLIPAFVFFFAKLYPFPKVNDRNNKTAAAAGGCILIETEALNSIGGIEVIREALIDDCSLAAEVKSYNLANNNKGIWLGFTKDAFSLRPYPSLKSIWDLVARTAFTQLNYSPILLLGTVIGMSLIYLVPPISVLLGLIMLNWEIVAVGLSAWLLMSLAYLPTVRFYQLSPWWAFNLSSIALLYTLMTVDSALRHWQGKGGAWKGRVYPQKSL